MKNIFQPLTKFDLSTSSSYAHLLLCVCVIHTNIRNLNACFSFYSIYIVVDE